MFRYVITNSALNLRCLSKDVLSGLGRCLSSRIEALTIIPARVWPRPDAATLPARSWFKMNLR